MNKEIINNLYKLWEQVAHLSNKLKETDNYSSISMNDSDCPNRVFKIKDNKLTIDEIIQLSREKKIPNIVAIEGPNNIGNNSNFKFLFEQRNMSLDLKSITKEQNRHHNIKKVKTKDDFKNTACLMLP